MDNITPANKTESSLRCARHHQHNHLNHGSCVMTSIPRYCHIHMAAAADILQDVNRNTQRKTELPQSTSSRPKGALHSPAPRYHFFVLFRVGIEGLRWCGMMPFGGWIVPRANEHQGA